MSEIKEKTISGLRWSMIEKFSSQGVSFMISIIIARLLTPADYGLIGLTAVFIGIPQVFISSGFGTALVKKIDRTEVDFSTMFYYNTGISLLCYLLLFIGAPFIASYFNQLELSAIIRILGLNFVFNSFQLVQIVKCRINLDFKIQAKISFIGVIGSGSIGLLCAFCGFGVWALVIQSIAANLISLLSYSYFVRWYPKCGFSKQSFKELFGYGSKILLTSLLNTVFGNIYNLVIGKCYSISQLGYYTRAQSLGALPSTNVIGVLQNVSFPVLSKCQENEAQMVAYHRKMVRITCYVLFPIFGFLIVFAKPLILVLLTDKWLPAAPFLQILSIGFMFGSLQVLNSNPLYVKGKTNLVLYVELINKLLTVIMLAICIPLGIMAICIGSSILSIVTFFVNIYYVKKVFPLNFINQLKDVFLSLSVVGVVAISSYCFNYMFSSEYVILIVGGLFSALLYILLSKIFLSDELMSTLNLIGLRRSTL